MRRAPSAHAVIKSQDDDISTFGKLALYTDTKKSVNVRAIKCVAGTLGYSVLITMFIVFFLVLFGSLEFTQWSEETNPGKRVWTANGTFVPQVDSIRYLMYGPLAFMGLFFTMMGYFVQCGYIEEVADDYCSGPYYAFLVTLPTYSIFCSVILLLIPVILERSGAEILYRGLVQVPVLLILTVAVTVEGLLRRRASAKRHLAINFKPRERSTYRNIRDAEKSSNQRHAQNSDTSRPSSILVQILNIMPSIILFSLYPLFLVPIYLTSSDGYRLFFACVAHPLLTEVQMTMMRLGRMKPRHYDVYDRSDACYMSFQLTATQFLPECISVTIRRFLLSSMVHPTNISIAVILTGVEEILLRVTLTERDTWVKTYFGHDSSEKRVTLRHENAISDVAWTAAIAHSMIAELIAIFSRLACSILLYRHNFVFSFTSNSKDSAHAMLFFNTGLELLTEIAVDFIAVRSELNHNISVDSFFDLFHNVSVFITDALNALVAVCFSLFIITVVPNAVFCGEKYNVCSCTPELFPQYAQWCVANSTIAKTNTTHFETMKEPSVLEELNENDMSALIIGISCFIAIIGITLASDAYMKSKNAKVRVGSMKVRLTTMKESVKKLRAALNEEQQQNVDQVMDEAYYLLEKYKVPSASIDLKEKIGRGAFGEVFVGMWNGHQAAIKKMHADMMSPSSIEKFREECALLAKLQEKKLLGHQNICRMLCVAWDSELLLVLKYYNLGSLAHVFLNDSLPHDRFVWKESDSDQDESSTLFPIAIDIGKGCAFLHGLNIIHRDLKPENVLVDYDASGNYKAVVSDFGEAREMDEAATMTQTGTPFYVAPEVMLGETYNQSADVYSFAMILLQMSVYRDGGLSRCWKSTMGQFNLVMGPLKGLRPELPSDLHPVISHLIEQCWKHDPTARPSSFTEIVKLLTLTQNGLEASLTL